MVLHYGHRDKITLIHHPTTRRHAQPPHLLWGAGRGRQASWVDDRFGGNILRQNSGCQPLLFLTPLIIKCCSCCLLSNMFSLAASPCLPQALALQVTSRPLPAPSLTDSGPHEPATPGSIPPLFRPPRVSCREHGSIPGRGITVPHAALCDQRKDRKVTEQMLIREPLSKAARSNQTPR